MRNKIKRVFNDVTATADRANDLLFSSYPLSVSDENIFIADVFRFFDFFVLKIANSFVHGSLLLVFIRRYISTYKHFRTSFAF